MVDTVTPENIELFREKFCVESGHNNECVCETVILMAKVMAGVCACAEVDIEKVLDDCEVEVFKKHLEEILEQKNCDCDCK